MNINSIIPKRKSSRLLVLLFFSLLSFSIKGQQVNVTTIITPPYGYDLQAYAYQTRVLLMSTQSGDYSLSIEVKGDNGISLKTPPSYMPFDIVLDQNMPYTVNGFELEDYLNFSNLNVSGVSQAALARNGLPEGRYQICIAVIDEDGVQVSPVNSGCSNFFTINYIDPPRILFPICGNKIQNTQSQNIVFSWSAPSGSNPVTTEYTLRMVEMANPDLPPEQALSSNALPFFETEIFGKTSFFYGPNQPLLEKGKKYAFEVSAKDDELQLKFLNQGRSPACYFQFGEAEKPFAFDTEETYTVPSNQTYTNIDDGVVGFNESVEPAPWLNFSVATLKGKLRYFYNEVSSSQNETWPLANMPIKFKMKYYVKQSDGKLVFLNQDQYNALSNELKTLPNNWVVGSTVTSSDGSFLINFSLNKPLGKLQDNISFGTGEFNRLVGELNRAVFIEVQDDHYLHPTTPMVVQPNQTVSINGIYSKVRSFNLEVKFKLPKDEAVLYNAGFNDVEVFLLRKTTPSLVPITEVLPDVSPMPIEPYYTVVGVTVTKNRSAYFERVLFSQNSNDKYYLMARSKAGEDHSYYYGKSKFMLTEEELAANGMNYVRVEYNDQLLPVNYVHDVYLRASDPIVHGQVREILRNDILPSAPVSLIKMEEQNLNIPGVQSVFYPKTIKTTHTDANGDYSISFKPDLTTDINMIYSSSEYSVLGSYSGYDYLWRKINDNAIVQYAKKYKRDLVLNPDATLSGKITTESRVATPCTVYVIDSNGKQVSKNVKTNQAFGTYNINTGVWNVPEWASFELKTPSGNCALVIDPDNNNYFQDTIALNLKKGKTEIVHVLKEKTHKIRVVAINEKYRLTRSSETISIIPVDYYIKGAEVIVKDRNVSAVTDMKGRAVLDPFKGGNNFTIEVIPAADQDFEPYQKDISNAEVSKDYSTVYVYLKRAAWVSGKVTLDGNPVKDADVVVKGFESEIFTKTDASGKYKLRNVPIGNGILISASKAGTNLIGQTKQIDINEGGVANVDFILKEPLGIDWTTLYGFPVAVDTASIIKATDHWIISGWLNIEGNDNGLVPDESSLPFYNLKVKPKSTTNPQAIPVDKQIILDKNTWTLTYNDKIKLIQNNSSGLQIKEVSQDNGGVMGLIRLDADNSFEDVDLDFSKEEVFLTKNAKPEALTSITASYDQWTPTNYFLQDKDGKGIDFKWQGFDISSDVSDGKLKTDHIELTATVHTNISNIAPSDMNIKIGKMMIKKEAVQPIQSSNKISAALEQWSLEATKWNFSKYGFVLQDGIVKTHAVDVPFTNISVKPTQLQYGQYQLDKLTLNGILDVTVTGDAEFYHDGQHWKLAIVPKNNGENAATIKALPAIDNDLSIADVSLFSNKTGAINVSDDAIQLHGLVSFEPEQIIVDDQKVKIPGLLSTGIPEVPKSNAAIVYSRQGGQLKFGLQPFTIGIATQGVVLNFDVLDNSLSANRLYLKGTLSETGLYAMNVDLEHKNSGTIINTIPGNEFKLGKTGKSKLTNIVGKMTATSTTWNPFVFEGDATGTTGMEGRLKFKVIGNLVANNQEVGVDNISTPFGGLNVTYDFNKSMLVGHLDINTELGSSGHAIGAAEMAVGDLGWYFCGGASLTMKNNPYIKEANMALLFGDYPVGTVPFIRETFETYAYEGNFPKGFSNNLSGFYIDGSAVFPLPYVPDIDVDLVVVHGELWVTIGGSFNMGMNFTDGPNYFRTGSEVFVHGHIGLGGSIGIACAGASLDARLTLGALGEYWSNGSWSLNANSTLKLKGSAYAGGGCCDSDCDWIKFCPAPCISDDWSGTKTFGLRFHMGSDEDYFKVDF